MSAFLEFDVYLKASGGGPYITQLLEVQEADLQLSMSAFIRNKINQIKGEGKFVYLDSEIVHLKTGSGRILGRELLHKTVFQFHSRCCWIALVICGQWRSESPLKIQLGGARENLMPAFHCLSANPMRNHS